MKQIIQSFKTGQTILEKVPAPQVARGTVLIQTTRSLVSLDTECMLVEFGKSNLISKARQQPDKVKQALSYEKFFKLIPAKLKSAAKLVSGNLKTSKPLNMRLRKFLQNIDKTEL